MSEIGNPPQKEPYIFFISFENMQSNMKVGGLASIFHVCIVGYPINNFFLSCIPDPRYVMRIGMGSSQKKIQRYRSINDPSLLIFVSGSIIMGKEPLTELKFAIFKNWLDTRPKMETHDPNVYPTILGGVSRGFWTPFLNRGAPSAIFWHLKTGTFAKMVG